MSWYQFKDYVSVAEKKQIAQETVKKLQKKGKKINPIVITGKNIASTFWGKAWCKNLESYRDYENRLPRGRSYVRNGAVIDLQIEQGKIEAQVQGSRLYKVSIEIVSLTKKHWNELIKQCSSKISSLIELLQGKFSNNVMEIITAKSTGLFPEPSEIKLNCSCPDHAIMCKHVAAVLYGIGSRLDFNPEELFVLRSVNHLELINISDKSSTLTKSKKATQLNENDLSSLFDIDIEQSGQNKNNNKEEHTKIFKPAKKVKEKTKLPEEIPLKTTTKPSKKTVKKKKTIKKTVKSNQRVKSKSKSSIKPKIKSKNVKK